MKPSNSLTHEEIVNLINIIARSSDDLTLDAKKAALYLGISFSTLARLRQSGSGPKYIQYPTVNSKARNQKVTYKLKDLRDWQNLHRVNSSIDAAFKRGMTLISIGDLIQTHPFWTDGDLIINNVFASTPDDFISNFKNPKLKISWLNIQKIFSKEYKISNKMIPYKESYLKLLKKFTDEASQAEIFC